VTDTSGALGVRARLERSTATTLPTGVRRSPHARVATDGDPAASREWDRRPGIAATPPSSRSTTPALATRTNCTAAAGESNGSITAASTPVIPPAAGARRGDGGSRLLDGIARKTT